MTKQEIVNKLDELSLSDQEEISKYLIKTTQEQRARLDKELLKTELCKMVDDGKVSRSRLVNNPYLSIFDFMLRA